MLMMVEGLLHMGEREPLLAFPVHTIYNYFWEGETRYGTCSTNKLTSNTIMKVTG